MSNTNNNARFAIEAKGLRKSFGSNLVLNELDMSVDWGVSRWFLDPMVPVNQP